MHAQGSLQRRRSRAPENAFAAHGKSGGKGTLVERPATHSCHPKDEALDLNHQRTDMTADIDQQEDRRVAWLMVAACAAMVAAAKTAVRAIFSFMFIIDLKVEGYDCSMVYVTFW